MEKNVSYTEFFSDDTLYFPSVRELFLEFFQEAEIFKVRFHMGFLYYCEERFNDAIVQFEKSQKLEEKRLEPLIFLGKTYLKKQDINRSLDFYKKAINLDRNNKEAQELFINTCYEKAKEYERHGFIKEEIDTYNEIISFLPEHIESVFFHGFLCMKEKNEKEALKYFTRYIEENPQGNMAIVASELIERLENSIIFKIDSLLRGIFGKK